MAMRIKKPMGRTLKTSFGTVIVQMNPKEHLFSFNNDYTAMIDTPLEYVKGTKKTFMKGSTVNGTIWLEQDYRNGKQRKVVLVSDRDGRYLVPTRYLEPTTQAEIDAKQEIDKLNSQIDDLIKGTEDEIKKIEKSDFMSRKYGGFTGKQIIIGALGVIILVKLFK